MDSISNEGKQHRKRRRKLLNSIQEQLDFYFSDANLRHDRFMRKEIEENYEGYVSLETMLKFNKLKNLGTEMPMLIKAVENSTTLQLSEDGVKVKRTVPVPNVNNTDADARTVYVEQLQAYCDHTWIKQVFSTCGSVDYVSLPRYKHDNKIKGFAFVEFSNALEAEKACRILNTVEDLKNKCKKRNPADKEQSDLEETFPVKRKRRRSTSACESDSDSKKHPISNALIKRRRSVSECSEGSPVKLKKKRKSSLEDRSLSEVKDLAAKDTNGKISKHIMDNEPNGVSITDNSDHGSTVQIKNTPKQTETNNLISIEKEVASEEESDSEEGKKKKRKNRKHTKKDKQPKEIVVPPLYVISKGEWLLLKRQYKHLQRTELHKLKNTMRILKSEKVRRKELKERISETITVSSSTNEEKKITKPLNPPTLLVKSIESTGRKRKLQKEEINENIEQTKVKQSKIEAPKYELEPGSVARISTTDDSMTKDIIKNSISPYAEVAYVDFISGSVKGYLRFKSGEMLNIAMETPDEIRDSWKFKIEKLEDIEEKEYFKKAIEDRRKRFELNEKKKKRREERGTSKVLKLAEGLSKN